MNPIRTILWPAGCTRKKLMNNPRMLLWIGFILVFLGFAIPFLIVIKVLSSTFFLNFLAFGTSVAGLFLGVLGTSGLYAERQEKNRWMREDWLNSERE